MSEPAGKGPKWKAFERAVYELQKTFSPEEATITLNDHIPGHDSHTERQVDISIRTRVANYEILIAIDCKDHSAPLDVNDVDAFGGLLRDIRANKGVLVSSSGFTKTALETARTHGIDTLRYVDTESVDWRSYVGLPTLLERTYLKRFRLHFSPVSDHPLFVPAAAVPKESAVADGHGRPLGTIGGMIAAKWNSQEIPHLPGVVRVALGDDLIICSAGQTGHTAIVGEVEVARTFYFGPWPVKVRGFRNEQSGALDANFLGTEYLNPYAIETGTVKGWRELGDKSELSVTPAFGLVYSDALPEDIPIA